jgi:glutamyl-tRNA synthetase
LIANDRPHSFRPQSHWRTPSRQHRTAFFCWLNARHCGGQLILRIEDVDRGLWTEENVDAIFDVPTWLGLDADEGPFFQTHRLERYEEVANQWLEAGKAYHCYCTREELELCSAEQMARGGEVGYDGRCRDRKEPLAGVDPVMRLRNAQEGEVVVNDLVRGRVVFDNAQLDDLIIARSDGTPTYTFAVIVDDFDDVLALSG